MIFLISESVRDKHHSRSIGIPDNLLYPGEPKNFVAMNMILVPTGSIEDYGGWYTHDWGMRGCYWTKWIYIFIRSFI